MFKRWAHENLRRFRKAKCNVWHLHQGSLRYGYGLGEELTVSNPEEKHLGVLADKRHKPLYTLKGVYLQPKCSTVSWAVPKHGWEEGGDCPPVLCLYEILCGILFLGLWPPALGRCGAVGLSLEEGCKDH